MQYVLKLIVAIHTRAIEITEKDRGATATEYALLVAFIALAIVIGVTAFGSALNTFFTNLGTRVGLL
jgi:pilus assembly protein Flp/PilA